MSLRYLIVTTPFAALLWFLTGHGLLYALAGFAPAIIYFAAWRVGIRGKGFVDGPTAIGEIGSGGVLAAALVL